MHKTPHELIEGFDPNGPGLPGKLFGLPFTPANASLVIVPVPWEVTVSYKAGTANGPDAVRIASSQVDLFLRDIPDAWKLGVAMLPIPKTFLEENRKLRELAVQLIDRAERGERADPHDPLLLKINEACESLNIYVKSTAQKQMAEGRVVGLLGETIAHRSAFCVRWPSTTTTLAFCTSMLMQIFVKRMKVLHTHTLLLCIMRSGYRLLTSWCR